MFLIFLIVNRLNGNHNEKFKNEKRAMVNFNISYIEFKDMK